jgi:hypothetical protein
MMIETVVFLAYRAGPFADPLALTSNLEPDWCVGHRAGMPMMNSRVVAMAQRFSEKCARSRAARTWRPNLVSVVRSPRWGTA